MKRLVGLYIHIPFCKQKCFYCDFPSYSGKERHMDRYVEALIRELEINKEQYKLDSIFIGGGTPSYLTIENMESLFKAIKSFEKSDNMEFTVECNPGTVSREKFKVMKEGGVNRISFGLQSTNNRLLKAIGRIHTYEDFKGNYNIAREVGFDNINVDLMFGLPEETVEEWKNDLIEICKLNVEHISAYSLIIEEGTVFYNLSKKGDLKLPTEENERIMYELTREILNDNGYNQYEISNYCKKNYECYHNKIYWKCKEYLGVGASASSYINGTRRKNINSIEGYINNVNNIESIIEEEIINTEKDKIEEFVFMGLRMTEGISLIEFSERFNGKITSIYKEVIDKNIDRKLLILENDRLRLTMKGVELSNVVMSDFIL